MVKITPEIVKAAWNAQADEFNQWDSLGEDEKLAWAIEIVKQRVAQTNANPISSSLKSTAGMSCDNRWDQELHAPYWLLRECAASITELIEKKPGLAGLQCGNTTLGNLKVELNPYRKTKIKNNERATYGDIVSDGGLDPRNKRS